MKLRLFPQETAALDLLATMAQQSVLAVQVLSEMFGARRQDYQRIFDELLIIDRRKSPCRSQYGVEASSSSARSSTPRRGSMTPRNSETKKAMRAHTPPTSTTSPPAGRAASGSG